MAKKIKQEKDANPVEIPKDLTHNLPRGTTTSILAQIPQHLKEPEAYEKVQKALYEAGASTCDHSEVGEWATCFKCQRKQSDRLLMMKSLGFLSKAHYMTWRKIHEELRTQKRDKLSMYNREV